MMWTLKFLFVFRVSGPWKARLLKNNPYTVDGSEIRRSPVEVGSLFHYFQGFMHPRWLAAFLPSTVSLIESLGKISSPIYSCTKVRKYHGISPFFGNTPISGVIMGHSFITCSRARVDPLCGYFVYTQKTLTFRYTGCLIGILIYRLLNPYLDRISSPICNERLEPENHLLEKEKLPNLDFLGSTC